MRSDEQCADSPREGDGELRSRRGSELSNEWRSAALAVLLLAGGCGQPAGPVPATPAPGEWRTFEGTWSASGTRHTLNLGPDHRASTFDLKGSLLLIGEQRLGVGFQAEVIGFSDSLVGMQGRCVWTDERGDQVYSELNGQAVGAGNHIVGTFLGGTGRYAGATGEYTFQWQYVLDNEDGAVSGRVVDLKGRARVGTPALTSPAGVRTP